MANVRITPMDLHRKAESFRRSASNLFSEVTRINQEVSMLLEGWESDETLSIHASILTQTEGTVDLAKMLVHVAAQLDAAANSMEQADEMIASSFFTF